MRVVIVADHVLFREGLASILASKTSLDVVGFAGTTQDAVNSIGRLQAELVLMDVNLPDGSGLEVLRQIMAQNPACNVVMLAGVDSDEYLFESFRLGARGYMLKNTPSAQFLKALDAIEQGQLVLPRQMMPRLVREFARLSHDHSVSELAMNRLTTRELDVLRQVGGGADNSEIAARLVISEHTVKAHLQNIRKKLGLNHRSQVVNYARRAGLSDPL